MEVTSTTQAASSESAQSAASNSSDIETEEMSQFLRLLTAQIENQDPLEPLDANQFVDQLATINTLEQQIQSNQYLAEILEALRPDEV